MRLIDADALKEQFKDKEGDVFTAFHFYETIDNAQTIEEHKGRWVMDRYCSNCDWSNEDVYFTPNWTGKYCPNCGAKMELPGLMKSIKQWEEAIDECGYIN